MYEMDHPRACQGGSSGLPVAHPEVHRSRGPVPVRAGGQGGGGCQRKGATSYDCPGDELGHHGKECSFDAILKKYGLASDPALLLLAKIVNGADTDNTLWNQPESAGLNAIAEGFRQLGFKDDLAQNHAEWIVYDALYAYCQEMIRRGKAEGAFKPSPAGQTSGQS